MVKIPRPPIFLTVPITKKHPQIKTRALKVIFSIREISHNECYTRDYLNLVRVINNPCSMYESNTLYESDDEGSMGYFSDNEMETSHHSVHTVDYSSDDSDVSVDEWNWREKENIVNIN
ncbi:hypothetical protein ABEB36_012779 [Hypothenemus hampei]|uniref:Uncharacterized protein n=1 Tax=Hypothenemus hampei TaxID=57062 RepID=A0ABD1ECC7_HYPHA